MDEEKTISLLGLCRRAGRLQLGADCVCDAVRSGKAKLVILASDASENTAKKIRNCASFYGVRLYVCEAGKETLGHGLGRSGDVSCAAVCDDSFAVLIGKHIGP